PPAGGRPPPNPCSRAPPLSAARATSLALPRRRALRAAGGGWRGASVGPARALPRGSKGAPPRAQARSVPRASSRGDSRRWGIARSLGRRGARTPTRASAARRGHHSGRPVPAAALGEPAPPPGLLARGWARRARGAPFTGPAFHGKRATEPPGGSTPAHAWRAVERAVQPLRALFGLRRVDSETSPAWAHGHPTARR